MNNHGIKCCLKCTTKRHPGCHDTCPEYIAEKQKYLDQKNLRYSKEMEDQDFQSVRWGKLPRKER